MTYDIDLVIDLLKMADDLANDDMPFTTTDKLREAYSQKYADSTCTKKFEEHLQLLFENGFVDGSQSNVPWEIFRVTWKGRDFVANAGDKELLEMAKKVAGNRSFAVFVETLDRLNMNTALKCAGC